MKINWQIPVMIFMILFAGCSKDKEAMNGELIIEDLKVGEGSEVVKYNIVTVNYGVHTLTGDVFANTLDGTNTVNTDYTVSSVPINLNTILK